MNLKELLTARLERNPSDTVTVSIGTIEELIQRCQNKSLRDEFAMSVSAYCLQHNDPYEAAVEAYAMAKAMMNVRLK